METILKHPSSMLRKPCEVVTKADNLQELVSKMQTAIREGKNGLGIAANQVGVLDQVILIGGKRSRVMINPVILMEKGGSKVMREGSLSYPGVFADIERPRKIKVGYTDENGENVTVAMKGMEARIVQHLIDQMRGIPFIDRAKAQNRWTRTSQKQLNNIS